MQSSWVRHLHIGDPSRPGISIRHHALSTHIAHEHHRAEALVWNKHGCIGCMQIAREGVPRARCAMPCSLIEHHNLVNRGTSLNKSRRSGCCDEHNLGIWIILFDGNAEWQRENHIAEECCLYNDPLHVRHRRCCHDHNSGRRRSCSSSTAT